MLLGEVDDLVVLDPAGGRQDHVRGGVVAREIGEEIVAADRLDRGRGAQHRAAERLARQRRLLELVEDDVVGRVERLADLLQDDAALALQLVGIEHRVAQDVDDHLDTQRHVLLQDGGVIGGDLAAGIGVQAAADILDLFGDGAGAAGARALEGHVLQHVGHAVQLGGLVPRAAGDPDAERRRFDLGHRVDGDPQAVAQRRDLDIAHVAYLASCCRCRRGHLPAFVDHGFQRRDVVRHAVGTLGALQQVTQTGRQARPLAGRLLDGVGELGGMRRRQHDHGDRGVAAMLLRQRVADGGVRIDRLAETASGNSSMAASVPASSSRPASKS